MFKICLLAILIFFCVLLFARAEEVSSMKIAWKMEGVMADACQCRVFCPCEFQSFPTFGHCDDTVVLDISQGSYGNVVLDGMKVTLVGQSPEGKKMGEAAGNLNFAHIYVSKESTEEQVNALVQIARIFFGKVIGQERRISAKEKIEKVKMDTKQEPYRYRIQIPNILDLDIVAPAGGDRKSPLVLKNSPYATLSDILIGKSNVYSYASRDGAVKWNYSGRSASIRNFRVDSESLRSPDSKIRIQEQEKE